MMLYINTVIMPAATPPHPSPQSKVPPLTLPPHLAQAVWSGRALGGGQGPVLPSGHVALDAHLPGGGWPCQALTEVLQAQAGLAEWRLLLPALVRLVQRGGQVLLVGAPWHPQLTALAREGLPEDRLVCIDARSPLERLWATEQALKAGCLSAVLAWLPQVRAEALRRLQACAARHAGPVFIFRPEHAGQGASPAPLRLHLGLGPCPHPLQVRLLKRRGPQHGLPIVLPHWPVGLATLLPAPALPATHSAHPGLSEVDRHVALDRTAAPLRA